MANKNSKIRNLENRAKLKGKTGVISQNEKSNMQMVVLHNQGDAVKGTSSLTIHQAIDKNSPIAFRNHKYMDYRQPYAKN